MLQAAVLVKANLFSLKVILCLWILSSMMKTPSLRPQLSILSLKILRATWDTITGKWSGMACGLRNGYSSVRRIFPHFNWLLQTISPFTINRAHTGPVDIKA